LGQNPLLRLPCQRDSHSHGSEDLTPVLMRSDLWCSLVKVNWRSAGTSCLNLKGQRASPAGDQQEGGLQRSDCTPHCVTSHLRIWNSSLRINHKAIRRVVKYKWVHNVFKIWGSHGGDYEECRRLLWYKNTVRTWQKTHYVSATEPSRLMLCNIWGFHGDDYEECRRFRCYAVWLLWETPSSGWQESTS
jgi:hypothetical protein